MKFPYFVDLKKPEKIGLNKSKNFYIAVSDDVKIGAWHVLPRLVSYDRGDNHDISSGHPIVLYLHGNAATRGQLHRVELYKVLSQMDFHVIAIDYRGFADSTGTPTEDGVLEDSYKAYRWIKDRSQNIPLYIWGHSLGTAISTNLVRYLNEKGENIDGLILESPFHNLQDAARSHPMSLPYRFLPWFEWIFIEPMKKAGLNFDTNDNVKTIKEPILILHAEDDHIIPVYYGRKLYDRITKLRNGKGIIYKEFNKSLGYRHCDIYRDPNLQDIIRSFIIMCGEMK